MKTRYLTIVCAGLICSFIACNREMNEAALPFPSGEFTVVASFGDKQNTRTAIVNETEVWWTPNDAINVFYGNLTSGRFVSLNAQEAATATFTGSLSSITGTIETGNEVRQFWAVYPYNVQNTCDGSSVTLTVPVRQKGEEGTFGRNTFPAIATSSGLDLAFYNVCGGMVLTVNRDDIRSITLRGKNNETLAGTVRVAFVDDSPAVLEVVQGEQAITFRSSGNKPFIPGTKYFITVLPVAFSQGYSLTFVTENGAVGTKEVSDAKTINRSRFLVVNNADADVSFAADQTHTNLIRFADDDLKDALVAAFDTDSDGELSYDEAAAVTSPADIKAAFGDNTNYTSFNELQYFTGITSVVDGMFQNWTLLESIVLPETIKSIGNSAFEGCVKMSNMVLPEGVESLGRSVFSNCLKLASIVIPEGIQSIPWTAFANCSMLKEMVLPRTIKSIESSAFQNCSEMISLTIPSSNITSIGTTVFAGCTSIEYLYIDDIKSYLDLHMSACCATSKQVHLFISGEEVTTLSFPEELTSIPSYAIRNCAFITSVFIPESISIIERYAFQGCTGLTEVKIPEHVSSIEYSAFSGCYGLACITVNPIDVPKGSYNMFSGSSCPILVPAESVEAYKTATEWSNYASRIMPIMAEGDDASVSDNVTARYLGGAMSIVNGVIQSNSKLNYGVYNNSDKSIDVLTIQLLDGETGAVGNMMSVNRTIDAGANQAWTITIGAAGIHSPTAIFVYRCEGKRYEIRVPYPD